MNRTEADKEDLMVVATGLVERAEYDCENEPITVGFRRDGCLSVYFNQEQFYQFDADALLRRAWENGFLYRSQGDTLAELNRQRTTQRTVLQRRDLTAEELLDFRRRMVDRIKAFIDVLQTTDVQPLREVTTNQNFRERILVTLQQVLQNDTNFLSKAIRGRK